MKLPCDIEVKESLDEILIVGEIADRWRKRKIKRRVRNKRKTGRKKRWPVGLQVQWLGEATIGGEEVTVKRWLWPGRERPPHTWDMEGEL